MNSKRLLKLADHLDSVAQVEFDLGSWKVTDKVAKCKTVACACGHATSIPSFRRAGLRLQLDEYCSSSKVDIYDLVFGGLVGFKAAAAFFDIGEFESENLFSWEGHRYGRRGPKSVAARIRQFVARKQKEIDKQYTEEFVEEPVMSF